MRTGFRMSGFFMCVGARRISKPDGASAFSGRRSPAVPRPGYPHYRSELAQVFEAFRIGTQRLVAVLGDEIKLTLALLNRFGLFFGITAFELRSGIDVFAALI